MAELLDRSHSESRERLDAGRAAVLEYELLEAALAALGDPAPAPRRAPARRRAKRAPVERPALGAAPAPAEEVAASAEAPAEDVPPVVEVPAEAIAAAPWGGSRLGAPVVSAGPGA